MKRIVFRLGGLAAGVVALAALSEADAKTWTQGAYNCEDGKLGALRAGAKPLGTAVVTGVDNVGQCLSKCDGNGACKALSIKHVPEPAKKLDNTTCTLYGTTSVAKTNFPSIQGKQWGAVCIKK